MAELRRVDSYTFKRLFADGESTDSCVVMKHGGLVEKAVEAEERTYRFLASDGGRDRDNDTISPQGWDLEGFLANPVILFGHSHHMPPIGSAKRVFVEGEQLKEDIHLPELQTQGAHRDLVNTVEELIRKRILRASSVGFLPREFKPRDFKDDDPGVDFVRQELIETSIVPVPSNPRALHEGRGFEPDPAGFLKAHELGVDIRPVQQWVESVIDLDENLRRGLDIRSVERAWKATWGGVLRVDMGRAAPRAKGVISFDAAHPEGTPVADEDAEWNGQREVAQAEVEDLRVMAAWVAEVEDDDEPSKADFKLPHHRAEGEHAVVLRGVNAAMAALLGARGGVDLPEEDEEGIHAHLARHLRSDFDREPPEFRGLDAQGWVRWVGDVFGATERQWLDAWIGRAEPPAVTKRTGEVFQDRIGFRWNEQSQEVEEQEFDNFFVDREGEAQDAGASQPAGTVTTDETVFVVVREDRSGEEPSNRILSRRFEAFDEAATDARRRAAEAADANLVFLVGQKVGELGEEEELDLDLELGDDEKSIDLEDLDYVEAQEIPDETTLSEAMRQIVERVVQDVSK